MAPPSPSSYLFLALLAIVGISQDAPDYDDYVDSQSTSISSCPCPCVDERDGRCAVKADAFCYQPICPGGYYLCCATCSVSTCAHRLKDMITSARGRKECITCPPGHYCEGCDVPQMCPLGTFNRKYGMSRIEHCIACPRGYTATNDGTQCCDIAGSSCTDPPDPRPEWESRF
ncbi:hypothetical protein FOL47_006399 [Perkinsus chesapeaki]|uniref:Uncharacterized protein n=1 Tax=Perkinsus chesapeaki TaxID=330153 RepID=A0A7J6LS45_PERCH|nr:hypothetical protein FOL47_006399 [Perkinsus chesapeaki]